MLRRKRRSAVLLLASTIVLGVVIFALVTRGGQPKTVTSYGFDSPYEVRRAEDYVHEVVLRKQEKDESGYTPLESGPGRQSTHCVLDPPPPTADQLVCSVINETRELYSKSKVTRLYRWKATVHINPQTSALLLEVHGPNTSRPTISP